MRSTRTATRLGVVLAAGIATFAGPALTTMGPAQAQEVIDLTAIDGYPPRSMWVREFINFYIPEIDRRLAETGNYRINWHQAWAGQIVKPRFVLEGLEQHLGDIGVVTTLFHHDKVPLQAIAYVTPFVTKDPALVARTIDELAERFPHVKDAFTAHNQVYLTNLVVLDSYQMFAKEPVSRLGDFDGKKVAVAGINARYLESTSAATVGGSLVSYYNKLKTGVVDAAMLWPEAVVSFKIVEVAPYMLQADLGPVNSKAVTVNADAWAGLPDEVKQVLQEAAIDYRDHTATVAVDSGGSSVMAYKEQGGEVVTISDADRQAWANAMPNIAKVWADGLEERGLPGHEILKAYMDIMRANDQPILRHWDRELAG